MPRAITPPPELGVDRALAAVQSGPIFIVVIAVVAVVVLASSVGLFPAGPGVTVISGPNSDSVASVGGLRLTLRISSASINPGGSLTINVTETNTNASPLSESTSSAWAVIGFRVGECHSSIYPFGVAVYQGHYTEKNSSGARPLNLYPPVPCPLLIRYISGYYFYPSSDIAVVLPGSGQGLAMTSGVLAQGNYTSGSVLDRFTPGQYTVAAGDEWGALTFLYFFVA